MHHTVKWVLCHRNGAFCVLNCIIDPSANVKSILKGLSTTLTTTLTATLPAFLPFNYLKALRRLLEVSTWGLWIYRWWSMIAKLELAEHYIDLTAPTTRTYAPNMPDTATRSPTQCEEIQLYQHSHSCSTDKLDELMVPWISNDVNSRM